MDETNIIREFIEKFFKNIGSNVEKKGKILSITKVPENFEKFYGKKSPYLLVFEQLDMTPETELVSKGSYLLKAINETLENKAQTSLIKIQIAFDAAEKIEKAFPLRNAKITRVDSSTENRFFTRFSFLTVFQYLNEREQVVNHIYVRKGEIFNFNPEKFTLIDGKKQDLKFDNVERFYEVAKNKLSETISTKVIEVGNSLKKTLNREIERIDGHFNSQIKEYLAQINSLKKQFQELTEKIENTFGEELEKAKRKLEKISLNLKELETSEEMERARKDKEFLINDEKQKHTLNIKTRLINTSIIYYPFCHMNVYFDTDSGMKMIPISYDPIDDNFFGMKCGSCESELNEIIVCSSGHLVCRICGQKCNNCGKISCSACLKNICSDCHRKICSSCAVTCYKCKKIKCKEHTVKEDVSKRVICTSCMKKCSSCGRILDESYLKRDGEGRYFCLNCRSKTMSHDTLKKIFS